GFTAVEQRQQVRVLEMCRDLDLGEEALDAEHRAELRVEHLQGHGAVMAGIVREKHGRHATPPDLAFYLVAVGDRDLELLEDSQREAREVVLQVVAWCSTRPGPIRNRSSTGWRSAPRPCSLCRYGSRCVPPGCQCWRAQDVSPEHPCKRAERLWCRECGCRRHVCRSQTWTSSKIPC